MLVGQVGEEFGRDEEVLGSSCCCRCCVVVVWSFMIIITFFFLRFVVTVQRERAIEHAARDAYHAFVNETFVAGIHALIYLVDDAEGRAG